MNECPQALNSRNIDLINPAFTAVMGAHRFISEKEFQDRKAHGKTNDAAYKQIDLNLFNHINLVGNNPNAVVSNLNTDFMTLKIIAFEYRESYTIGITKSKAQPDQPKLIISYLSTSSLDPPYDYDFTYIKDIVTFMRGDIQYKRLCGWQHFALKVSRKYDNGNDKWLSTDKNAWPVSYYGTAKHNAKLIAEKGYDLSKGKRFAYGRGIYSTPDVHIAEQFAADFMFEGKEYVMIFKTE
ncbi:ubiquitin-domain-containing protein [Gigaspora margarita]|uniref:Ubiquitin-domain-containing protein n=1 Tax=Gigaspora margarita TaxID=4874 RepID=A0A8H4EHV7_GIGMA|nr:ubiquitin-domain-containing protein [Gigaspora margarita]